MNGQVFRLVVVVTGLWVGVLLVSQVLADPPLSPVVAVAIGVVLTNAAIVGFGSVLRGPRRRRSHHGSRVGSQTVARTGLTPEERLADAATRTVRLVAPLVPNGAVAVTDLKRVVAFEGPDSGHHGVDTALPSWIGMPLAPGERRVAESADKLDCHDPACLWQSACAVPIELQGNVVGAAVVYRCAPDAVQCEIDESVARVVELHMDLARLEAQGRLDADARLEALRAQINPHFLFNTLNTIASKVRTDPDEGRALLQRLGDFFRYAIRQHGQFAEFAQEFYFVRTYVSLEQARYGDKLRVMFDIDPQVLSVDVPVLVIQPLVENAIKHGLALKVGRGTVTLRARVDLMSRQVDILVRDDGVGMDGPTLRAVLDGKHPSDDASGVGLRNITERLTLLFGERAEMDVKSALGDGTTVRLRLPLR